MGYAEGRQGVSKRPIKEEVMSPDITMCSPTKFTKKCQKCYRMTAKPDKWQSYANLSKPCQYMPEPVRLPKEVTIEEYNTLINNIIGKHLGIDETLIALLNEASKLTIAPSDKIITKKGKRGQKANQIVKRFCK